MKNIRILLTATSIMLVLFLTNIARSVNADSFSMPEEQVNYSITRVNDVLWAKIDGTYPISYSGSETSMMMVYPTPPGTTNISITLNDVELDWNNFTEVYPEERHHTAIGDWSMISTVLEPVSSQFVLKIHYEHPVQVINGSYTFLYDLNISPYLSASENKSVAHFTVRMETEYSNLKVNTVFGEDEALRPIEFTVSGENPVEIKIDEVSEFGKPLPGDLLVSFSEGGTQENADNLWLVVSVLLVVSAAVLVVYLWFRMRRNRETR
jgi:hypothetical protein